MRIILGIILSLFVALPAHAAMVCQGQILATAADGHGLCTKNFHFVGTCNGGDQTPSLNDGISINTPFVPGWEPVQITIRDVWIVFIPPRPSSFYAFAGNSYTPDIMTWITSDGVERHMPSGTSMEFPSSMAGQHIDLHISCTPVNTPYQGFYTVVYQPI